MTDTSPISAAIVRATGCRGTSTSAGWTNRRKGSRNAKISNPCLARDEATAGRICPECGIILARYRIGHGMSFQLDYCRRCNGVWFDRQEWDDVRAKKRSRND
jgi:hypothetical protein